MRWFLAKLIILGLAILLLVQNPGTISVHWLGWRISTSLGVFLTTLLIVTIALGLFMSGWEGIRNFVKILMSSHSARKRQKGREALREAFTALEIGAHQNALVLAQKAFEFLPDNNFVGLALLKAGIATNNRLAIKQGSDIVRKVPGLAPIPVYHDILECIREDQWNKAEAYIVDAIRDYPTQPVFLKFNLLKEVHMHQWEEAQDILNTLVGEKIYTKPYAKQIEGHVVMHQALKSKLPTPKKLDLLKKAFQLNPEAIIATTYATALAQEEDYKQARKVLETSWKQEPSWSVGQLYCELEPQEKALAQARNSAVLAKMVPGNPGRILNIIYCLRARLWGEAKDRLEKLNEATALKEIFLVALQRQNKVDHDKLCAHFKKALESAMASPTINHEQYLEQLVLAHESAESSPFITPAQVAEMVL
jgi:HemY protein